MAERRYTKPPLILGQSERIRLAIEIIGVDKTQARDLTSRVKIAINLIDRTKRNKLFGVVRSDAEKKALKSFRKALLRLKVTYSNLGEYERVTFPLDENGFETWVKYCEAAEKTPLVTART